MQAMRREFLIAATCRLRVSVVRPTLAAEDENTRRKSNMTIDFTRPRTGVGRFGARRPTEAPPF